MYDNVGLKGEMVTFGSAPVQSSSAASLRTRLWPATLSVLSTQFRRGWSILVAAHFFANTDIAHFPTSIQHVAETVLRDRVAPYWQTYWTNDQGPRS